MRFRQRIAIVGGTTVVVALGIVLPAAASAAGLYVSNSAPVVANGKSCAQPGYSKIQKAIDANKGNTIDICPGTYTEQLTIERAVKLAAVNGVSTATVAMPAVPAKSSTSCDSAEQTDEISICGSAAISIAGLNIEAIIPLETCGGKLNGIFVGGGATLKATSVTIDGASTSLDAYKGCQHGLAALIGSAATPAEVGHAVFKNVTVDGYEKNGPTAEETGSTLTMTGSTVTGEGASPYTAQNGVQISYGASGTIKSSSVSDNECDVATCGATGEQASGVLFYQAAPGSAISSSTVSENDLGVYYASGSDTVPASPDVTVSKDVLTSNRYEGVELEEGKALLKSDTINGTGRVGIDLFQYEGQASASQSSAKGTKVDGQSEAAIKVESDKKAGDIPGEFTFNSGSTVGDGTVLINESNAFEVIL